MAAIITEKFRQSNADSFSADIASSKYYMFVGKSQPWTSEGATTDNQPPTPVDSVAPESYYWDDMLAAKLISSKSFVIPRRDFATTSALICTDMMLVEYQLVIIVIQKLQVLVV